MGDIWTVARKELLELIFAPKSFRQLLVSAGFMVLLVDVFLPFTIRNYSIAVFYFLGFGLFSYFLGPMFSTADTFAGERERHSLETLLSTRLEERSIVLGKLLALVIVAHVTALGLQLQGLVVVSLLFGRWEGFLIAGPFILGELFAGTALAVLLGSVGIMISSRAQTVQSAAQAMSFVVIPLFMIPMILVSFVGEGLFSLVENLSRLNVPLLAGLGFLAVVVLDAVVLGIVLASFNRDRLMAK